MKNNLEQFDTFLIKKIKFENGNFMLFEGSTVILANKSEKIKVLIIIFMKF